MRHKRYRVIFYIVFIWVGSGFYTLLRAQNTPRPSILGISSVGFRVSNLAKARDFYQGFLGYKTTRVTRKENRAAHLNFKINDRQHLEIYAGLAGQDERMLEVAFQVTDAEAMRLYLQSKGLKVPDQVTKGPTGILSFVVADPENHLVKFIQYQDKNIGKSYRKKPAGSAISDRILHVGITVSDVKQMDAFYQDILGFSEIWRGGRPDSVTNWINMKVPEGTDYVEYMLIKGKVNKQQLGVLHHVALQVPSMQNALDILRKRGSSSPHFVIESPRIGRNNRWQLNLYDPDGTRVELMEPFPMR